jgi:hypothetical protein
MDDQDLCAPHMFPTQRPPRVGPTCPRSWAGSAVVTTAKRNGGAGGTIPHHQEPSSEVDGVWGEEGKTDGEAGGDGLSEAEEEVMEDGGGSKSVTEMRHVVGGSTTSHGVVQHDRQRSLQNSSDTLTQTTERVDPIARRQWEPNTNNKQKITLRRHRVAGTCATPANE